VLRDKVVGVFIAFVAPLLGDCAYADAQETYVSAPCTQCITVLKQYSVQSGSQSQPGIVAKKPESPKFCNQHL
jgi:hypothetical protein